MNESSIEKDQLREQLRGTRKLVPDRGIHAKDNGTVNVDVNINTNVKQNPSLSSLLVRSSKCLPSRDGDDDYSEWSMPSIATDPTRTLGAVLGGGKKPSESESKSAVPPPPPPPPHSPPLATAAIEDDRQAQDDELPTLSASPSRESSTSSHVNSQEFTLDDDDDDEQLDLNSSDNAIAKDGSDEEDYDASMPLHTPMRHHSASSASRPKRMSQLLSRPASVVRDNLVEEPERPDLPSAKSTDSLMDGRFSSHEKDEEEDEDETIIDDGISPLATTTTTIENDRPARKDGLPTVSASSSRESTASSYISSQEFSLDSDHSNLGSRNKGVIENDDGDDDEDYDISMPMHVPMRHHSTSSARPKRMSQLLTRPPSLVGDSLFEEPERPNLPSAKSTDSLMDGRFSSHEKDKEEAEDETIIDDEISPHSTTTTTTENDQHARKDGLPTVSASSSRESTASSYVSSQEFSLGSDQNDMDSSDKATTERDEDDDDDDYDMSMPMHVPIRHHSTSSARPKRMSQLLSRPPSLVGDSLFEEPERPYLPSAKSTDSLMDGRCSSPEKGEEEGEGDKETEENSPIIGQLEESISIHNEDDSFDESSEFPRLERMASPAARPKRMSQLLSRPASLVRVMQDVEPEPQLLAGPRTTDSLLDGRESFTAYSNEGSTSQNGTTTWKSSQNQSLEAPMSAPTVLKSSVSLPMRALGVDNDDMPLALPLVQHTSVQMHRPKRTSQLLTRPASLIQVMQKEEDEPDLAHIMNGAKSEDTLVDGRHDGSGLMEGSPRNEEAKIEQVPPGSDMSIESPMPGAYSVSSPVPRNAKARRSAAAGLASLTGLITGNRTGSDVSTVSSASVNSRRQRRGRNHVPPPPQRNTSTQSQPGAVSVSRPTPRNAKARRSAMLDSGDAVALTPPMLPGAVSMSDPTPRNAKARRSAMSDSDTSGELNPPALIGAVSMSSPTPRNAKARRSAMSDSDTSGELQPPALIGAVSMSDPTPRNAKARRSALMDAGDSAPLAPPGAVGVTSPTPRNAKARRGGTSDVDVGDVRAITPPGAGAGSLASPGAVGVFGGHSPRNAKGRRGGNIIPQRNFSLEGQDMSSSVPPKMTPGLSPVDSESKARSRSLQLADGGRLEAPSTVESLHGNSPVPQRNTRRLPLPSTKLASDSGEIRARPPRITSLPHGGQNTHQVRRDRLERGHYSLSHIRSYDEDDAITPGAIAVHSEQGFSRHIPYLTDGDSVAVDSAVDNLSVAAIPGSGVGAQYITNTDTVDNIARFNSSLRTNYVAPPNTGRAFMDAEVRRSLENEAAIKEEGNGKRKSLLFIVLCVAVLVGIGIAIAIPLSGSKKELPGGGGGGEGPIDETPAPTPVPTAAPTSLIRLMNFMDVVEPISSLDLLEDPSSPQREALEWLAFRDPVEMDPTAANEIRLNGIRERYSAALLYFAMGGDQWFNSVSFLSESSICAWNDGLTGTGIACDGENNVARISLGKNGLKGSLPAEICSFENLDYLSVSSNQLTGDIPPEIGNCKRLRILDLTLNNFENSVPANFVGLTELRSLALAGNKLTGTFPTEIISLPRLEEIFFASCRFTGQLPTEIGSMQRLALLHVNSNLFDGNLPSEIGLLTDLTLLHLGNNFFDGPVPSSLGSLTNLLSVEAHGNSFSGTVPSQLQDLSSLVHLTLENNLLNGDIDPIFCDERTLPIDTLKADCLSSIPVKCTCCTDCY